MEVKGRTPSGESVMEARMLPSLTSLGSLGTDSLYHQRLLNEPAPAANAVLAACIAGIGPFVFGYSLGFTSPVLTAMTLLKSDAVFTDANLQVVSYHRT